MRRGFIIRGQGMKIVYRSFNVEAVRNRNAFCLRNTHHFTTISSFLRPLEDRPSVHDTVTNKVIGIWRKRSIAANVSCFLFGFDKSRPDTGHKMRLVCVLFTFENNTGHTDGPTNGRTDGPTDGRTQPLIDMRRRI